MRRFSNALVDFNSMALAVIFSTVFFFTCCGSFVSAQVFQANVVSQTTNPDFVLDDTDGESWAIEADEPVPNAFSIASGAGSTPVLVIEAGAPVNNFYIESSGEVGIGTNNPVGDLNIHDSNGSGSAAIQFNEDDNVWAILTNTRFQVTQAGGTRLSVQSDGDVNVNRGFSASGTLFVSDVTDRVGVGISIPAAPLHIRNFNDDNGIIMENLAGFGQKTLLELTSNGAPQLLFSDISNLTSWELNPNVNGNFIINSVGLGGGQEFTLTGSNGNLRISGQMRADDFIVTSARDSKENFVDVDPVDVLRRLVELPVTEWTFKENGVRHMGPVAEDFKKTFGLGGEATRISMIDACGVALAAIKGIQSVHDSAMADTTQQIAELRNEKDAEIAELKNEVAELKALVNQLVELQGADISN